jgi:hypothetical protein
MCTIETKPLFWVAAMNNNKRDRLSRITQGVTTLCIASLAVLFSSTPAVSECRRTTPPGGAFGIDSGTLCTFGDDGGDVIPSSGSYYGQYDEKKPIFSYQEQRAMLRNQYARGRRGSSSGLLNQAVSSSYRPLGGPSRRVGLVVFGGGGR